MTVITISREIGSGGGDIAQQVAKELGYHLVDKPVIEQVLLQYGFAQFSEEYEFAPNYWSQFDSVREQMIGMLDRVIRAFARQGDVVIVGRGSFAALGDLADVLNVRVQAPVSERVARIMATRDIATHEEARQMISESDELRYAFIQSWYHTRWDAANAFDLVISTGKVAPELAVKWILETNHSMPDAWIEGSPTTRDLVTDVVLAETVENVLARKEPV